MAKQKAAVYLTESQYQTLVTTGTITVEGVTITYSPDDTIYYVGEAKGTPLNAPTVGAASYAIVPNVVTQLGTLASTVALALDDPEDGIAASYTIIFTTPATAPTITFPTGLVWFKNEFTKDDPSSTETVKPQVPNIEASKTYEISILQNEAIIIGY